MIKKKLSILDIFINYCYLLLYKKGIIVNGLNRKKAFIILLFTIFIIPSVPSYASDSADQSSLSTHTVLVEVASSQGCSGCSSWNAIINNEFLNGIYDFEFVEMIVYDHLWDVLNNVTYDWNEMFGISSYPTSVFDGGFDFLVGSNPTNLPEVLENSQNRTVSDIDAQIQVLWYHPATLEVSINITNNEPYTYDGSIRSHIAEIESRYSTSQGHFYHNGFLDFAFNKNISIPPYGSYTDTKSWDATLHKDAHGDSFGDIEKDNIKVYLTAFDKNGLCDEVVITQPVYASQYEEINQSVHNRGFPIRHAADGDWGAAQNFTSTQDSLSSMQIYLRKFGTPEFNLSIELHEDAITGPIVETFTFTPSEILSSWKWLSLNMTNDTVVNGKKYFITIPPAPSGISTSFGYEWGYAFGNQYDNGAFWFTRDGGNLWRDLPTMYEFTFKTFRY